MNENEKKELKTSYGDEMMNDAQAIKELAIFLDENPASLAGAEAYMEKNNKQDSKQFVQYNTSQKNGNDTSDCQLKLSKYSACMTEYNSKIAEYNSCLSEKVTNPYKICSKPSNLCGFKPICY